MKRFFLLLFLFQITLLGNFLPKEWVPIYTDENSTIYLNETKIIGYGNDISVWAIEEFNETQSMKDGTEFIKKKSHYLFNKMKRRYASVGDIYYNKRGKIVNRSSSAGFQNSSPSFMASIKSSPKVEVIYKETISFLITGTLTPVSSEMDNTKDFGNRNNSENDIQEIVTNEDEQVSEEDNSKEDVEISEGISEEEVNAKEKMLKKEKVELEKIETPNIKSVISLRELDKNNLSESINIASPKPAEYNQKNEKALKGAIFTDGNLYCIQVSSWKTKAYADRELNKLLDRGFNAFIVSVKPRNKRSIWHRVRVGYFNSLNEAKLVQKEIKQRK